MVRAVFPGTFDPIHYGHIDIALRAQKLFDELIVAVYDRPLKSLLFTPEDRLALVQQAFAGQEHVRVTVFSGLIVKYCQQVQAQVIVRGLRVYPENMRRNLELTQGVIFSQRVLLALIDKGLAREEAYKLVQRNAIDRKSTRLNSSHT